MSTQQLALENYANAMNFINKEVISLLKAVPSAARIRIGFVRPPAQIDSLPVNLRYDVTHVISSPGHTPSELSLDHSVTEWSDFFNDFMANKCVHLKTSEILNSATVIRLKMLHVSEFVGCPIWNTHAQMLGAIFVSWEVGDLVPADMIATEKLIKASADRIGLQSRYGM